MSEETAQRAGPNGPRRIDVSHLARVEGHGALQVEIDGDRVTDVRLELFEPPRFFEALLSGRRFTEAPDITARICGICPVAYQMSACHAMEAACGVRVDGPLRDLRRLLYCGEWIESHALHVYMLHAPDFLGYAGSIEMAEDHPEIVRRGLQLKKVGNDLMSLLGGREIHPINVRVGGFYRVPRRSELAPMVERLEWARDAALETVRWVASFDFPDLEPDYELVALRHPDEYPMNEGRLVSSRGLDIEVAEFDRYFEERHLPHTNALHARIRGRDSYLTGPLARYSLNHDRLAPAAREAARDAGLGTTCTNPYRSIVVRSVEILQACEDALRILRAYEPPDQAAVEVKPRAGVGHGCTEAPRGILYHRYEIDDDGVIRAANIVPPTSQNQLTIEADLGRVVEQSLHVEDPALTERCEGLVRCYDPCISCATHFLDLRVVRR
jgi:coenzyme F420-reducing hydrogenase alpha subunit